MLFWRNVKQQMDNSRMNSWVTVDSGVWWWRTQVLNLDFEYKSWIYHLQKEETLYDEENKQGESMQGLGVVINEPKKVGNIWGIALGLNVI